MEVNILYNGGVKFEGSARGHRIVCDQPASNGGADRGMTPPEFLLVSLGTCAGYYAAEYLKTRHLPADGLAINVRAEKLRQPARLGQFQIEVTAPELEERHHEGILRAVKSCLIHNTLLHAPDIDIHLNTADRPLATALT
jgi:uncharacterized OsmC-like protein